jgi:hypothetical protein
LEKEMARKNKLPQEGLDDLEEEIWAMRRQEVATALTRFAPHAGEEFPRPEGGWVTTPGPVAKLLLLKLHGFDVPTRNKPRIPRECVEAIVQWWKPLFPDEEVATDTLDEMWAAIEKWRPDVDQDAGALTSEAVERFARMRVEEENAQARLELEQRELERHRAEIAAKRKQDEAAAAEFADEVELQSAEARAAPGCSSRKPGRGPRGKRGGGELRHLSAGDVKEGKQCQHVVRHVDEFGQLACPSPRVARAADGRKEAHITATRAGTSGAAAIQQHATR